MSNIIFNRKHRSCFQLVQCILAPARSHSLRAAQKLLPLVTPRLFRNLFAWRLPHLLFAALLFLLGAPSSFPQAWSGIIDPSRAVDWSNAGIPGGIPSYDSICATISPSGKTDSTDSTNINNAIASCGGNQVVSLNAGTYTLTNGVLFNKSNVVLRGAGPTSTILKFTGGACTPWGGDVCVTNYGYYVGSPQVQPGGSNATTWTAGYSKGATQITVGSASGLSVGQVIILDQANDTTDPGPGKFIVCDANVSNGGTCQPSTETPFSAPGRVINGVNHNQQQIVKITAINGNVLTISPGLYAAQWSSAKSPGVWWAGTAITNDGIENLTLDHTSSSNGGDTSSYGGIIFDDAYQCWVKNIRSINAQRNHVWLYQSARVAVVDSYFYGVQGGGSLSYGVEMFMASDCLIQNNIFQHVTSPVMTGTSQGCVIAYNYATDDYYTQADWLTGMAAGHDAGAYLDLFEGNEQPSFGTDLYHGTPANQTFFRNWISGWQTGKTGNTNVSQLWAYSRLFNIVGNVMGTPGYHLGYEYSSNGNAGNPDTAIYVLGYSGADGQSSSGIPYDDSVQSSLLRWGNYDTVTQAVRWCGSSSDTGWLNTCGGVSEVPSGIQMPTKGDTDAGQPVMPASFYVSAKPNWWGTMPWPATGPDVSGGNDPTGHSYANPAHLCYSSTPLDTSYHPSGTTYGVTSASWTNGTATLIVGTNSFSVGQLINVDGVMAIVNGNSTTSNGYNGAFRVTAQTGATVSYSVASNPGTYSSGGTAAYPSILAFSATNCYSTQGSPTFVQGALVQDSYNDPNINSTSLTFASPVTTGHLLWGFFAWDSATATNTVTDNCGNTWTNVGSPVTDTSAGFSAQIAYVANATGGSACTVTMTVSQSISPAIRYMTIHEVSGISGSSPLDGYGGQINGTTSGGGCASADCLTSGNFTTTANGDYIAVGMADIYGNGAAITAGTGYALREGPDNLHDEELTTEDCVQSAASSSTVATFTPSAFSHGTLVVAAFKHR